MIYDLPQWPKFVPYGSICRYPPRTPKRGCGTYICEVLRAPLLSSTNFLISSKRFGVSINGSTVISTIVRSILRVRAESGAERSNRWLGESRGYLEHAWKSSDLSASDAINRRFSYLGPWQSDSARARTHARTGGLRAQVCTVHGPGSTGLP